MHHYIEPKPASKDTNETVKQFLSDNGYDEFK